MTRNLDNFTRALACGAMLLAIAAMTSPALAQQGSLYVVDGKVGIGTETPTVSLDVRGNAGTTALLIDENSASPELRTLLTLENAGPPRIIFSDTAINKSWRMGAYFGNAFRFDSPSGPGVEMELYNTGNLTIRGTLSQGSSRSFKENFAEVDPQQILDRVAALPISSWNYLSESSETRHLGPVAEDFRATFGLGQDDRHLAPSDAAGVALAAIQGLNQVVQSEKADRAEVLELRDDNDRLRATIDALATTQEQLLKRLEALEQQDAKKAGRSR